MRSLERPSGITAAANSYKANTRSDKVRDHDQFTCNFLRSGHNLCKILRPVNYQILVFFYIFRGYDSNLIVLDYQQLQDRENKPIGHNIKKISFGSVKLAYGVSILAPVFRLVAGQPRQVACGNRARQFQNLNRFIPDKYIGETEENLKLFERKCVFCYDHSDAFKRIQERQLPPHE